MLKTMYVIDVIPLAMIPRNQAQLLSYFHSELLAKGAVVEISLNKRKIKGVVLGGDTIKNRKLTFKKSVSFELKNIARVINPLPQVFDWQFQIAGYLSTYYYAPLGICLKTALPPFWGKKKYELKTMNADLSCICRISPQHGLWDKPVPPTKFIETKLATHHLDYQKDIEAMIERGRQVFLMTAEKTAANYFLEKFRDLNPSYVSSDLPIREHYEIWQNVAGGKTKLIVGTRVGLFLPFSNLGLIIVDDESNESYKSDMTPRYHAADLASEIARIHQAEIVLSAVVPRLETWNLEHETRNIRHETPGSKFAIRDSRFIIQDMVQELRAGNFSIFSRELQDALLKIENLKLKIILYIPRRGHANFILCQTCGQPLTCPNCSASLIPHALEARSQKLEVRIVCHHCNYIQPYPKQCPACGSYKLKAYGIGIEKVRDELKRFFAKSELTAPPILQLDSDSVKTETQEREIIKKFAQTKPAILLATQMIFGHKYSIRTPLLGIINADTLIAIPDFRTEESLFRQIYTLGQMAGKNDQGSDTTSPSADIATAELSHHLLSQSDLGTLPKAEGPEGKVISAPGRLIIQTHNPDDPAIKSAAAGQIEKFFDQELDSRRELSYPPFSSLVKLSYQHKDPNRGRLESSVLTEKLKTQLRLSADSGRKVEIIGPTPAFIFKERGLYHWLIILKLKNLEPKKRNDLLRLVPNGWVTEVDPKNAI